MSLYIGVNYHPHDWEPSQWEQDLNLMKQAGFTTVRLGHLCWDSYEPEEGIYKFEWFDKVMDLCLNKQIGVVLDISMHPAPVWVHKLCPGCDIAGPSGNKQASLRRYMEDVDDPAYQFYALRFAEKIAARYKDHPALFAFGLCNELGDGYLSHSEYARQRFVNWLKKKYRTIEELNKAWATQRWCRKLNSFDEVVLQENEISVGAPEAWLDMRRFFSDGVGNFLKLLKERVEKAAPGTAHSSNHYAEKDNFGFDYLKAYPGFVDYPGMGFYPGYTPHKDKAMLQVLSWYMERIAENNKPMWCLEFLTGATGVTSGTYGLNRMYAFVALLHRSQMMLGWTFRSMLNGEEQFLFGLLNHDGKPNQNYREYKQIAADYKKLEKYAFPYLPKPNIAVASGYDNKMIASYHQAHFRLSYNRNVLESVAALENNNLDYNFVNLRDMQKQYRIMLIPGYIIMDNESAETIRRFVEDGGIAVMSAYSATMDETGKVFTEPRPGRLSDVFGIEITAFCRTSGIQLLEDKDENDILTIEKDGECFSNHVDYFEEIELTTAEPYAVNKSRGGCAISLNYYGKGKAFYVGLESNETVWNWMLHQIKKEYLELGIIHMPVGVYARTIKDGQTFYVNTTNKEIQIPLLHDGYGVLKENQNKDYLTLKPFDGELIVQG